MLGPFLQEPDGQLLLNSLKEVKKGVFGSVLAPDWEDIINQFKEDLELAHSCCGLPITPKLHIIHRHMEQAVRQTGRSLSRLNEAAVEAMHLVFHKVWEKYLVKDEDSPIFLNHLLMATLRVTVDNARHS